jgi:hypothetical protein
MTYAEDRRRDEIERIEAALNAVPWPSFVTGREWKLDIDSTGKEAIWIWVVVPDYEDIEQNRPAWTELRGAIQETLLAKGVDLWPYVRARTESEPSAVRK